MYIGAWSGNMLKTAKRLQSDYNDFYIQFRKYVWEFDAVEALADLETEIYTTFPDISKIKSKCKTLEQIISRTGLFDEDADLQTAFDILKNSIEETDDIYVGIKTFKEVVVK